MEKKITVESSINESREKVWNMFNAPKAIVKWNSGSSEWHTTEAENNLRVGGSFKYRMEAKDGSAGFDFVGTYDEVVPLERIVYTMAGDDARKVEVAFADMGNNTHVVVTFDAETINPIEMQRSGWQHILNNLKDYSESH